MTLSAPQVLGFVVVLLWCGVMLGAVLATDAIERRQRERELGQIIIDAPWLFDAGWPWSEPPADELFDWSIEDSSLQP